MLAGWPVFHKQLRDRGRGEPTALIPGYHAHAASLARIREFHRNPFRGDNPDPDKYLFLGIHPTVEHRARAMQDG